MNRYANIKKLKNQNENVGTLNDLYYTNVTYPEIPVSANDIWVETEFGDRLDLLANQFYNDTSLYWIISCANPDKINMGSLHFPVTIERLTKYITHNFIYLRFYNYLLYLLYLLGF